MCCSSTVAATAHSSRRPVARCLPKAACCWPPPVKSNDWEAELRVAVDTLIPLARVYPLVAAFDAHCRAVRAAHTQLRISREVLGGTWDALAEGRADLVVGAPGDAPPGGGYRMRTLAEMTSVFAVAPGHPLATAREPLSETDIGRHRAVVAADSSRKLAPRSIGTLSGQDTLTVPDLEAKLAAQVLGLGCGFLPLAGADSLAMLFLSASIRSEEKVPA